MEGSGSVQIMTDPDLADKYPQNLLLPGRMPLFMLLLHPFLKEVSIEAINAGVQALSPLSFGYRYLLVLLQFSQS
jgi:hypothetical protein